MCTLIFIYWSLNWSWDQFLSEKTTSLYLFILMILYDFVVRFPNQSDNIDSIQSSIFPCSFGAASSISEHPGPTDSPSIECGPEDLAMKWWVFKGRSCGSCKIFIWDALTWCSAVKPICHAKNWNNRILFRWIVWKVHHILRICIWIEKGPFFLKHHLVWWFSIMDPHLPITKKTIKDSPRTRHEKHSTSCTSAWRRILSESKQGSIANAETEIDQLDLRGEPKSHQLLQYDQMLHNVMVHWWLCVYIWQIYSKNILLTSTYHRNHSQSATITIPETNPTRILGVFEDCGNTTSPIPNWAYLEVAS